MLEIKHITKKYKPKKGKPVVALDDVSIKFPNTGLVFILGKSGSGKSTCLNIMGGLDKADSGQIIIKGKSSKDFTQADFDSYRNTYLGFIFQEYNILNEFSVGANVALAIELQGRKATSKQINEILEDVDLKGYAKRKPMELSGGQKQRIAIARALVKNPDIILADEPTGALDSATGIQVFDTLKALSKKKLVVVVSHDREFAEAYGDRVIEFKDGKVISDIEKYVAPSDRRNESISIIDDKIISIEKGYELNEDDIKLINNYLKDHSAILSVDEMSNRDMKKFARIDDSGNKECFKDTNEETIDHRDNGKFKLIKSRLPYKSSVKIGASGLKAKPIRLFITILLSMVAFAMFGIVDTMTAYDKVTTTTRSLIDSDVGGICFIKEHEVTEGDYTSTSNEKMTDADVAKLKSKTGVTFLPVYNPSGSGDLSLGASLYSTPSYAASSYLATLGGFIELGQSDVTKLGYTLTGRMPAALDEVAITKYEYETIQKYGYKYGGSVTILPADMKSMTPAAFLSRSGGVYLTLDNVSFKIVGIIDTKFDRDHFKALDSTNQDSSSGIVSYIVSSELSTTVQYGYHGLIYVKSGFIANYETEAASSIIGVKTQDGVSCYFTNAQNNSLYLNTSYIYKLSDVTTANNMSYEYFNSTKTTLGEKEMLIDYGSLYHLYQSALNNMSEDVREASTPTWYTAAADWSAAETWRNEKVRAYSDSIYDDAIAAGFQHGELTWDGVCEWTISTTDPTGSSLSTLEKLENFYQYYSNYGNLDGNDWNAKPSYADWSYQELCNIYNQEAYAENYLLNYTGTLTIDDTIIPLSWSGSMSANGWYSNSQDTYTIVGLFKKENGVSGGAVVLPDSIYSKLTDGSDGKYTCAIAVRPESEAKLRSIVNYSYNNGSDSRTFKITSGPSMLLDMANGTIESMSKIFLYIGIGLAVFASFLLMNFISTSISYKKREIGILRAVGAKASDVFGIFFNESLIIALINFVLATAAAYTAVYFVNTTLRSEYSISVTLLVFSIRQVILMLLISILVAFISSFLPVYNIAKKRPVDAIRAVN